MKFLLAALLLACAFLGFTANVPHDPSVPVLHVSACVTTPPDPLVSKIYKTGEYGGPFTVTTPRIYSPSETDSEYIERHVRHIAAFVEYNELKNLTYIDEEDLSVSTPSIEDDTVYYILRRHLADIEAALDSQPRYF